MADYGKKKLSIADYIHKVKFLREWLPHGFNTRDGYDLRKAGAWSNARKRVINEYYSEIQPIVSRDVYVYRPRSKEKQKVARESMGLGHMKKITVAFIQVPRKLDVDGKPGLIKPKVEIKKGKLKTKFPRFSRDYILFEEYGFDLEDVALDPEFVLQSILEQQEGYYSNYSIIAGQHEVGMKKNVPQMFAPSTVINGVIRLIEKYETEDSHNWRNWLFGLIGYRFEKLEMVLNYVKQVRLQQEKRKKVTKEVARLKTQIDYRNAKIKAVNRNKKFTSAQKEKRVKKYQGEITQLEKEANRLIIARSKGL